MSIFQASLTEIWNTAVERFSNTTKWLSLSLKTSWRRIIFRNKFATLSVFFFFFLRILVSFWSIYTFNGLECLFKKNQFRSSHRRCEDVKVCNFIKKRLQRRCFPVKFEKFLGTSILTKICERLPLSTIAFVLNFERTTVWFKHLLLHKRSPKIYLKNY